MKNTSYSKLCGIRYSDNFDFSEELERFGSHSFENQIIEG